MSVRRILHLSDFHINTTDLSMLQNTDYCKRLIQQLNEFENLDTCVISGDLVDKGGCEDDYKEAEKFIKMLRNDTSIRNIIIVPGNHDVNRDLLHGIKGNSGIDVKNLWQYQEIKLKYYLDFIKQIGLEAKPESGLISSLILKNPNMVILGLNSNWRIGIEDGAGYIEVETLEKNLKNLFDTSPDLMDYVKIAVFHHRPIVYESSVQSYEANNYTGKDEYGTCHYENWQKIKALLLTYNVHNVLTGHVHGTQSSLIKDYDQKNDGIYYSTVGSIGVNFNNELIALIQKPDQELKEMLDSLACYVSVHNYHNSFNVLTYDEQGLIKEEQYKLVVDEGRWKWILWKTKEIHETSGDEAGIFATSPDSFEDGNSIFEQVQPQLPLPEEPPIDYEKEVLNIVREHKLYKTGHFHWKGVAMLNWIDASYFFNQEEEIQLVAKGICDIIRYKIQKTDCIIGLGIKGSIMLSYIRFIFPNIKCSYYPESSTGYNQYEKELFNDTKSKMDSITLLTDVVHSGNTIRNFISDNESLFSDNSTLEVITIFNASADGNINVDCGPINVNLYSLATLKVSNCTGNGENCPIYTQKLAPVYEYKEQEMEEKV